MPPFFNGGNRVVPHGLEQTPHQPEPVIDATEAAMMARMLARGRQPGHRPRRGGARARRCRQDRHDAGFPGCLVHRLGQGAADRVWLGNDDNQPMKGVMGGGLPARLFHDIAIAMN